MSSIADKMAVPNPPQPLDDCSKFILQGRDQFSSAVVILERFSYYSVNSKSVEFSANRGRKNYSSRENGDSVFFDRRLMFCEDCKLSLNVI